DIDADVDGADDVPAGDGDGGGAFAHRSDPAEVVDGGHGLIRGGKADGGGGGSRRRADRHRNIGHLADGQLLGGEGGVHVRHYGGGVGDDGNLVINGDAVGGGRHLGGAHRRRADQPVLADLHDAEVVRGKGDLRVAGVLGEHDGFQLLGGAHHHLGVVFTGVDALDVDVAERPLGQPYGAGRQGRAGGQGGQQQRCRQPFCKSLHVVPQRKVIRKWRDAPLGQRAREGVSTPPP